MMIEYRSTRIQLVSAIYCSHGGRGKDKKNEGAGGGYGRGGSLFNAW